MKRMNTRRKDTVLINVWMPESLVRDIDHSAEHSDTDRSKYIRAAVRERLARLRGKSSTGPASN